MSFRSASQSYFTPQNAWVPMGTEFFRAVVPVTEDRTQLVFAYPMGSGSTGSNIGLGSPIGRRHEIDNIKGAVERLDDDFDGYTLVDADGVDMVQIQTVIRAESTDSEVAAAVAKLARIADSIEASVSQVDEW